VRHAEIEWTRKNCSCLQLRGRQRASNLRSMHAEGVLSSLWLSFKRDVATERDIQWDDVSRMEIIAFVNGFALNHTHSQFLHFVFTTSAEQNHYHSTWHFLLFLQQFGSVCHSVSPIRVYMCIVFWIKSQFLILQLKITLYKQSFTSYME
jgi:hypothetical protein